MNTKKVWIWINSLSYFFGPPFILSSSLLREIGWSESDSMYNEPFLYFNFWNKPESPIWQSSCDCEGDYKTFLNWHISALIFVSINSWLCKEKNVQLYKISIQTMYKLIQSGWVYFFKSFAQSLPFNITTYDKVILQCNDWFKLLVISRNWGLLI